MFSQWKVITVCFCLFPPSPCSIQAGCQALPPLLSIRQVMMQRQVAGVWSNKDELPVSLPASQAGCLIASLFACLSVRLHVCLSDSLFACLSTYLSVLQCLSDSLFAWQSTCLTCCPPVSACQSVCLPVYILVCLPVCLSSFVCLHAVCLSDTVPFCGIIPSLPLPWYNHHGWLGVKKTISFPFIPWNLSSKGKTLFWFNVDWV